MMRAHPRGLACRLLAGSVATCALLAMFGVAPALAGVLWRLDSNSAPTYLAPGAEARIIATASNLGESAANGSGAHPVTITDKLPAHLRVPPALTAAAIEGKLEANDRSEAASQLECSIEEPLRKEVSCKTRPTTQLLAPFTELKIIAPVEVEPGAASGEENLVAVAGGEPPSGGELPPPPPLSRPITVEAEPTPFGIEHYELTPEEEDGATDTRAGTHPFQLTTTLDLNETLTPGGEGQPMLQPSSPALAKNLNFELPPGFLGNPQAIPQCSDEEFSSIGENNVNACPANTVIGVALVTLNLPHPPLGVFTEAVPVFNLAPAPGEPARFGLEDTKVPIILDTSVRTTGDYGVNVSIKNTTEVAQLLNSRVTLWGEPDNESHDNSRGWTCIRGKEVNGETCTPPGDRSEPPFLTLPTSCIGPLSTDLNGEAWTGEMLTAKYTFDKTLGEPLGKLEGCEQLPFSPQIMVSPVEEEEGRAPAAPVSAASTPAGMNVSVELPAEAQGLGESAVQDTTVTLPEGVQLSPSGANGLQACSETQVGFEGEANTPDPFSPGAPEPLKFSSAPEQCPAASKVGVVHIKSPDLAHELEGGVYIAQQTANPFGSLFALYIVAEDPVSRVLVKLAGEVSLNEETGQVTTTFKDTPQVPFEKLKLHFFEGPQASLSTPPLCGTYATTASFTPWSGTAPVDTSSDPFAISSGPGGAPCSSNPQPFAPSFAAGSENTQAGAFTPFTLQISNPDGDQALKSLSMQLPPGVAAILASVTPCPEPQASQGACGPESLIGHSSASSGLGSDPYTLPGQVFLTGPYEGAPFGLLVVTPAIAGPFNLGNVDVRSRINVNPETAAVSITSDPFPTFVKGVPAQLKQINVTVDRPGFEFNPTSCNPMKIGGTLAGVQGASEAVSSPFQVQRCGALPFAPVLSASAAGHGSKADGTSFDVSLESKGLGQANVARVDLQLPKALSSRLPTLQKACLVAVFDANPAGCDEGSIIGTATIHTPVLSSPLTGPAYLVAHGAEFPDVEFVLQGEGITLILDGATDIKHGITYSRFETAPDAPFTRFETILPAGPHGVLTPNVAEKEDFSLCKTGLSMPAEITSQAGTTIKQTINVAVTGCKGVAAYKATRAQLLAKALKACRKDVRHVKRQKCEKAARAKDGPRGKKAVRTK
jgi:hypothetical protein